MLRKPKQAGQIPDTNSGFTLIELLITIFLISVGLIGVISFFNASIQSQFDAKNEVIAAGLAQEETEIIRNMVDYNVLNGKDWWKNIASDKKTKIKLGKKKKSTDGECLAVDYNALISHLKKGSCDPDGLACLTADLRYYQCNHSEIGKNALFSRTLTIYGIEMNGIDDPPAGIDLNKGDCLQVEATVGRPVVENECDDKNYDGCDYVTTAEDIICEPRQ